MTYEATVCDICGNVISASAAYFSCQCMNPNFKYLRQGDTLDIHHHHVGKKLDVCLHCLMRGLLIGQEGILYADTGDCSNIADVLPYTECEGDSNQ